MLGSLRLLLAISVAVYHANLWAGRLQYGVCAVVIFYMISGYAMSGLAGSFLQAPAGGFWNGAARFWRDRILRLYPQYLFWLAVAACIRFGLGRVWWNQGGPLDAVNVIGNLTAVPLNLAMYVPSLRHMTLIPQGWSLSVELGFYAIFPLIWRSRAVNWALALGGFGVLALATLNVLPEDAFAYRLLPGTLPFFLIGRAMFCRDRALLATLAVLLTANFAGVWASGQMGLGYNTELLVSLLVGPPALALAVRVRSWRFDAVLGHTSYGTYLSHIAMILVGLDGVTNLWLRLGGAVVFPALAGFASYRLVEVPVNFYRRQLRASQTEGLRPASLPLDQAGDLSPDPILLGGR